MGCLLWVQLANQLCQDGQLPSRVFQSSHGLVTEDLAYWVSASHFAGC